MSRTPTATRTQSTDGQCILHHVDADLLTVLLIRHGQPGPGREIDGLLGKPLTAVGRRQAERLARRLEPVPLTRIYCSDMARSYQTATAVRERVTKAPMDVLSDLREISSFHHPLTEPARTAEQRQKLRAQREAADRFVELLRERHTSGEIVAVITHGNLNRLLLAKLAGVPSRQMIPTTAHHSSVTVVGVPDNGEAIRLKLLNCTRHLPPSLMGTSNL